MIWVVFAALTGASVLAVLWPLARRARTDAQAAADTALYRAELADIDRDAERGLVGEDDARAVKAEAARRLLAARAASSLAPTVSPWPRRVAALLAIVFIPALALGLYNWVGDPDYPDQPLEARLNAPPSGMDINAALAKIEHHLAEQPDDARGWEIVAPVYMKLGRPRDAAVAYQHLLTILGPSAERASAFGEALVYAEDGKVTPQARVAFEAALHEDETFPQARFFLGLAAEQDGDKARAIDIWSRLIADAPPDAPWASTVRERIAALGGSAPASSATPTGPAAEAITAMPAEQREATIRGMVDNLAARLAQNGDDVEGWLRLVRAYSVLNEPEKARAALTDARKALASQQPAADRLDALARELNLGG